MILRVKVKNLALLQAYKEMVRSLLEDIERLFLKPYKIIF